MKVIEKITAYLKINIFYFFCSYRFHKLLRNKKCIDDYPCLKISSLSSEKILSNTLVTSLVNSSNNIKIFKKCAVIFNGNGLINRGLGPAIDNCDFVIRINFGCTIGQEEDYGSKTDLRILGKHWLYQERNELLVHSYNKVSYFLTDTQNIKNSNWFKNEGLLEFSSEYDSFIKRTIGAGATNGFRAVIIALQNSEEVKIFGAESNSSFKKMSHIGNEVIRKRIELFSKKNNLNQDLGSYFDPISNNSNTSIHKSIRREYKFYQECSNITFIN